MNKEMTGEEPRTVKQLDTVMEQGKPHEKCAKDLSKTRSWDDTLKSRSWAEAFTSPEQMAKKGTPATVLESGKRKRIETERYAPPNEKTSRILQRTNRHEKPSQLPRPPPPQRGPASAPRDPPHLAGHRGGGGHGGRTKSASYQRCEHDGCGIRPSFGFHEDANKYRFCAKHKLVGMVDLRSKRCKHDGCGKKSKFDSELKKPGSFCARHEPNSVAEARPPVRRPACGPRRRGGGGGRSKRPRAGDQQKNDSNTSLSEAENCTLTGYSINRKAPCTFSTGTDVESSPMPWISGVGLNSGDEEAPEATLAKLHHKSVKAKEDLCLSLLEENRALKQALKKADETISQKPIIIGRRRVYKRRSNNWSEWEKIEMPKGQQVMPIRLHRDGVINYVRGVLSERGRQQVMQEIDKNASYLARRYQSHNLAPEPREHFLLNSIQGRGYKYHQTRMRALPCGYKPFPHLRALGKTSASYCGLAYDSPNRLVHEKEINLCQTRVQKPGPNGHVAGTIMSKTNTLITVDYEDGDTEDFSLRELKKYSTKKLASITDVKSGETKVIKEFEPGKRYVGTVREVLDNCETLYHVVFDDGKEEYMNFEDLKDASLEDPWSIGADVVVYRDGNDSIGWHSDNKQGETTLFTVVIECNSKEPRVVTFCPGGKTLEEGAEQIQLRVHPGDAYWCDGASQRGYVHRVAKVSKSSRGTKQGHSSRRIVVVFRAGRPEFMEDDNGQPAYDESQREPQFGHLGYNEFESYNRDELEVGGGHMMAKGGMNVSARPPETAADAVLLSEQLGDKKGQKTCPENDLKDHLETFELTRKDQFSHSLFKSYQEKQHLRVYRASNLRQFGALKRKGDNCIQYRYDGLYIIEKAFEKVSGGSGNRELTVNDEWHGSSKQPYVFCFKRLETPLFNKKSIKLWKGKADKVLNYEANSKTTRKTKRRGNRK